MIYKKNNNFVLRKIHDTYFLIDITDNYKGDKCRLIETNEIGEFVWNCLDRVNSVEEISKELKEMINEDVPYDMIYHDIKDFMESLYEKGIVVRKA